MFKWLKHLTVNQVQLPLENNKKKNIIVSLLGPSKLVTWLRLGKDKTTVSVPNSPEVQVGLWVPSPQ